MLTMRFEPKLGWCINVEGSYWRLSIVCWSFVGLLWHGWGGAPLDIEGNPKQTYETEDFLIETGFLGAEIQDHIAQQASSFRPRSYEPRTAVTGQVEKLSRNHLSLPLA